MTGQNESAYGIGQFLNYTGHLRAMAVSIVQELQKNGFTPDKQPHRQTIAMGEEAGELLEAATAITTTVLSFAGAYRRWTGQARRSDTVEHVIEELADVVITAFVTAEEFSWDLDSAIQQKAHKIMTRGWREEKTP